ncbi:nucleotide exchange factor GrpE [Pseudoflavonifractor sp. SW1122]|uniref:Protein GrpE n=1 Tax=Candidatus Enterenecus faecium TaxID=2840780 RepID=A0A9D0YSL7_9FIRM|nr:nucleotide exchange factor GrpE [Pseudoflavonifractor sp. SW1122]NJE74034.1 nucleotide exchange factor GrpE [Pseudoflavonifractor sp. SW1122]HIQ61274.1 nucleotide exchange factor GrpE [Candidatus Enterenecus faecium]
MDEKTMNTESTENLEQEVEETTAEPQQEAQAEAAPQVDEKLAQAEEKYLRLAAEYDNYRKRTAKEKESAWTNAKAQTVAAFLPVYDNLERALKQQTTDEAYAKGVEMTMKGLQDALSGLGVELIPALGETFDPNRHNAVMHVEDDAAEENTVVEVFQQGFTCGDKVIRFAMVKVAN